MRAVEPVWVYTTMARAPHCRAASPAAWATACTSWSFPGSDSDGAAQRWLLLSASRMIRSITATAFSGCRPEAVSAESMTASVPSKMALATSEASARVGRG